MGDDVGVVFQRQQQQQLISVSDSGVNRNRYTSGILGMVSMGGFAGSVTAFVGHEKEKSHV